MTLSDLSIRKAKPGTKAYKLSDGGGLYVLVAPSGTKAWRYKYRFGGKEKLLSLGTYPQLSLAKAREAHFLARRLLGEGKDPSHSKKQAKRARELQSKQSFEAVAREWHKSRLAMWTAVHAKKIMNCLEADVLPKIGHLPIAEISASELLDVVRKVEARKVYVTAHKVLQYSSQIFRFAIVTDRAKQNPADALRGALVPSKPRNYAHLKEIELPEFLKKLEAYHGHPVTKLALKFLVLTFVRTIEERGAEWTEINFEKTVWRIPPERMKMRDPHIVPLSTQAISVLKELHKFMETRNICFLIPTIIPAS